MVTLISSSLCKGDVYISHFHYILADFHYTLLSFKMSLINCFIQLHTDCDEVMCARQFICSNSTYKLPHLFFHSRILHIKTEESISDALSCCSMQFNSVCTSHTAQHINSYKFFLTMLREKANLIVLFMIPSLLYLLQ